MYSLSDLVSVFRSSSVIMEDTVYKFSFLLYFNFSLYTSFKTISKLKSKSLIKLQKKLLVYSFKNQKQVTGLNDHRFCIEISN